MKRLLIILLLSAAVAQAETYKWVDAEGTIHFSDSKGGIPEKYRKSAKSLEADAPGNNDGEMRPGPQKSARQPQGGAAQPGLSPDAEGLKERMMNDEGIMALIRALKDDPDMRALLSDPAMMSAVQAGDIGTLLNNPAFLKMLNNPRVREIERKLNNSGN